MWIVFACAVAAYATAVGGTFLYDDFHSVRDNAALRSLANLPSFLWDLDAFSDTDAKMYRPVMLMTLAIDHALGGGAAFVFKITDVLLHGVCAMLVVSVARCLRADRASAVLAGLLFAAHPLASEAVNFVSSRSDQLVAIGTLLALRLHFGALAGRRAALVGSALATALACGAKETGVIVPVVLLTLEFARACRRRFESRAIARRLAPSIGVVIAYLATRRVLFGVATVAVPRLSAGSGGDPMTGSGRDLWTQLSTMGEVLPRFLAQTCLPFGLSADPYVPLRDGSGWTAAAVVGWACVMFITWLGLRRPRRAPGAFVGTCAAWAMALPWVLIPLNSPANEHRFYGSLAALAVVFAATVPAGRWLRDGRGRAMAAVVVLVFGAASATRSLLYRDARLLWADALASDPASVAALRGLAQAHQDDARDALLAGDERRAHHQIRLAIDYAYRALGIAPRSKQVLKGLVRYQMALGPEHGDPMLAVVHAMQLVDRRPQDPFGRIQLSRAWTMAGVGTGEQRFFDAADRAAMSVLEIAEPKGLVYRVAAEAHVASGDLERALERLDQSIARGLDHRSVRLDRADVLLRMGRRGECVTEVRRVLADAPFDGQALELLERTGSAARPPR